MTRRRRPRPGPWARVILSSWPGSPRKGVGSEHTRGQALRWRNDLVAGPRGTEGRGQDSLRLRLRPARPDRAYLVRQHDPDRQSGRGGRRDRDADRSAARALGGLMAWDWLGWCLVAGMGLAVWAIVARGFADGGSGSWFAGPPAGVGGPECPLALCRRGRCGTECSRRNHRAPGKARCAGC